MSSLLAGILLLIVILVRDNRYYVMGFQHKVHNHGEEYIPTPTFAECNASYGHRDYLWITETHQPPMLLTFPGSGTTMTQLLLEYASGVYSGSIYEEDELYSIMPGLRSCGRRLVVVKAHVKDLLFRHKIVEKLDSPEIVTFKTNKYVAKCRKGMIHSFDRFILVLRSPWGAWWSNYQRDFNAAYDATPDEAEALRLEKKSHTGGIPLDQLNYTDWELRALESPHYGVSMYNAMWNVM